MSRRSLYVLVSCVVVSTPIHAHDFENAQSDLSIAGVVAGAAQCGEKECYGALPLQPEMSLRPGESHELFAKLGFAAGEGMNLETPFNIAPWAADLESDVESVSGRSRDYLLTAWYSYTARVGSDSTLRTSVGLIDATDYLDENAYSNDEYTQFMNSALVNGPNAFLPSYDRGVALAFDGSRWSARGVYMNIGENDDGNSYHFVGAQMGYHLNTALGEGNYRLLLDGTDRQFLDPAGSSLESRTGLLLSCDQQLGRTVGLFTRFAWQTQDAAVDYGALYSGGLNLRGGAWRRERDELGIGYAYLAGGNGDLVRSQVFETYYRVALNRMLAITGDLQYMRDDFTADASVRGFISGLRLAAEF